MGRPSQKRRVWAAYRAELWSAPPRGGAGSFFPCHYQRHAFRHSFATELPRKGVPLVSVGALLGHESLQSTARYTQPSTKDPREAVAKLALEEGR